MTVRYSEAQLEKELLRLLTEKLGYRTIDCTETQPQREDGTGRTDKSEVVLYDLLKTRTQTLNPTIPPAKVAEALKNLTARREYMTPLAANKDVYHLIRDGIKVEYQDEQGRNQTGRVKPIDFTNPRANDFLAVSQAWITGKTNRRRPDVILYVNGLPLVVIELKKPTVNVKTAYTENITDYKTDIPQLFLYNAFNIVSNAGTTRVGSLTAGWEHYFNWQRLHDEKELIDYHRLETRRTSLENTIIGLCTKETLLDYLENFILYDGEKVKKIAQNHQYLGVNKAVESYRNRRELKGKLGVFWHTQGSGKSISMICFTRKITRKLPGDPTFLIVTDRVDLDDQIYNNYLTAGAAAKERAVKAGSSKKLRDALRCNMSYIFTVIHKFQWQEETPYPVLTERDDVVVLVDEAHRTQYDTLAENMRRGLPNAQYIAFTGTPLLGRDRKTNRWFGDYVSEYNFAQSVADGATLPLFYQKRVPEVLVKNDELNDDFYSIIDEENLDAAQQEKMEKQHTRVVEIIKRDQRLETIARDIVTHFPDRGYRGKGIVVSVDKLTAVKMYDKVQKYWRHRMIQLEALIMGTSDRTLKNKDQATLDFMRETEMAVVISPEKNETEVFKTKGLDIKPHRKKMERRDSNGKGLDDRFKNAEDPLRLVFVCAMWMTGFDAPTVSTLYMDKPMKDHTLMQAIARANRVTPHKIDGKTKVNGEIIDYYNVFGDLRRALAAYAPGRDETDVQMPVEEKDRLFELLDEAIALGMNFCKPLGIHLDEIGAGGIFKNLPVFLNYIAILLENDRRVKEFKVYENTISMLYEACKPEILERNRFRPLVPVFQYLRALLDAETTKVDIDEAARKVSALLDHSVISAGQPGRVRSPGAGNRNPATNQATAAIVSIGEIQKGKRHDLSKMDFKKLKEEFKQKEHKTIEIAELRRLIEEKLERMLRENSTRGNFAERYQAIVDRYNSGSGTVEADYNDLVTLAENLNREDERHIRLGLTKDELELFDILKQKRMTKKEEEKLKLAAKALLKRLLEEHPRVLIQDWYKDSQSSRKVRTAVEEVLDRELPSTYDKELFEEKVETVFNMIRRYAESGRKWAA